MINFFIIFQRSREVCASFEEVRSLLPNIKRRHAVPIELQVLKLGYQKLYRVI